VSKSKEIISFYKNIFENNTDKNDFLLNADSKFLPDGEWVDEETLRLENLYHKEQDLHNSGLKYIAGIDEVGRGPLAGPLVAAAVVFDNLYFLPGLDDSKKLSVRLREYLCKIIKKCAVSYALSFATVKEIEDFNILRASHIAMERAVNSLNLTIETSLIDGCHTIMGVEHPQIPVIKGDSLVYSIAAASIIAKVERDRMMDEYHEQFPEYNFLSNKGYGTKEHIEALYRLGPCPIHRKNFHPVKSIVRDKSKIKAEQLKFNY
jgi:ribonuclease HII